MKRIIFLVTLLLLFVAPCLQAQGVGRVHPDTISKELGRAEGFAKGSVTQLGKVRALWQEYQAYIAEMLSDTAVVVDTVYVPASHSIKAIRMLVGDSAQVCAVTSWSDGVITLDKGQDSIPACRAALKARQPR